MSHRRPVQAANGVLSSRFLLISLAVALVLSMGRPGKLKVAVWIGAGLIATLVAFSRVYLGVHWWTDVVAGAALWGAWLCLLVIVGLLRQPRPAEGARPVST